MTIDTGSTKKFYELELVQTQLLTGASIFGCEDWMVFSDVDTWLSPGPPVKLMTVKVDFPHQQKKIQNWHMDQHTSLLQRLEQNQGGWQVGQQRLDGEIGFRCRVPSVSAPHKIGRPICD